jgi:ABC-type phosphate transport system auxiliary subunit
MKKETLALGVVTIALLLTIGVITMIATLTIKHFNNRKLVRVSYACVVVKGDRWIHRTDLKTCNYVVFESDLGGSGSEKPELGR